MRIVDGREEGLGVVVGRIAPLLGIRLVCLFVMDRRGLSIIGGL